MTIVEWPAACRWLTLGSLVSLLMVAAFGCEDPTGADPGVETDTESPDTPGDAGPDDTRTDTGLTDPLTVAVDPSLQPDVEQVPPADDGVPRPVARSRFRDDKPADFVANEVIVTAATQGELDAFLEQWNGTVVRVIDTSASELDIPPRYIVRIDTDQVDPSTIEEDLGELAVEPSGELRFSSEQGRNLVAAAARASLQGAKVGINWMYEPASDHDTFNDRSTRESTDGGGNVRDAFDYGYLKTGNAQNTGVADAWIALERAGALGNLVGIGVIDGGFTRNADVPGNRTAITMTGSGPYDAANPTSCSGGNACPWHGAGAVGASMGVPDNEFGAAGPAGPIAKARMVHTSLNHGDVMAGINRIIGSSFVINMSFSGTYSGLWAAWSLRQEGDFFLEAFRNGTVMIASAGNDDTNVDAGETIRKDPAIHWPCETSTVICVGALNNNANTRISYSNYGGTNVASSRPSDGTVDIYAPTNIRYVDPDQGYRSFGGTSAAAPFAAGVVALIRAAGPQLSHQSIRSILFTTANTGSSDADVNRWVNARAAVLRALGTNNPPHIEITSPSGDDTFEEGDKIPFEADVDDLDDDPSSLTVRWYWDDGPTRRFLGSVGPGERLEVSSLCNGAYEIFAEVGGVTDSVDVRVSNGSGDPPAACAPSVQIVQPTVGDVFREGEDIDLHAVYDDDDDSTLQPLYPIIWREGGPNGRIIGRNAIGTTRFGAGMKQIYISYGSAEDSVQIDVRKTPNNSPSATIVRPADGDFIADFSNPPYVRVPLKGSASDPEDGSLPGSAYEWSYRETGTTTWRTIGSGSSQSVELQDRNCRATSYDIRLRVTDSGGLKATDLITVRIEAVFC